MFCEIGTIRDIWQVKHHTEIASSHTVTYKSRLTPKKLYKKRDAISSIYGRNGIIPWHFFLNYQLGLSRSNDNRPLNFEAGTSKYGNHSCNFGSSPRKGKVDMCPIFFQTRSAQTKWAELAVQFSWKLPVF